MIIKQSPHGTDVRVYAVAAGQVFYGVFRSLSSLWLKCANNHHLVDLHSMQVYHGVTSDELITNYVPRDGATLMVP